jgi:hypothetical protein
MKIDANKVWQRIKSWVDTWPETWAAPLAILLFLASIPLFNWLMSVTQAPELAILQNILITGIEIAIVNAMVFLGILLNFRIIFDWYKKPHALSSDWLKLTSWERIRTFLALYLALFFAAVLLFTSLQ